MPSTRRMDRRQFLGSTLAFSSIVSIASFAPGQVVETQPTFRFEFESPLIPAPLEPSAWPEFRRQLAVWRERKRYELGYSDALYQRGDFHWASSSFACCFLMLCDETFYNPKAGCYTVKQFLQQAQDRFGGFDSIVLWHAYPRIGFDDRNQFDFYRDAPGGLKGLRAAVREMHEEGLKAFIDYNPWDTATRREGKEDLDALIEMVVALDADGIFLDTMDYGTKVFRAKLDASRRGVVLEGEGALPLERVHDHHLSWAQWFADSPAPGVLRNKWFERRHLQHQIQRWGRDHTTELHSAWMNGSGIMIWENVFGSWNGWCARDCSILHAMLPIQRRFAALFTGERWTPLVPTLMPQVYASLWEGNGLRLWTLVNRSTEQREGSLIRIDPLKGERVFDLVEGREIPLSTATTPEGVRGLIPPRGISCLIAGSAPALGDDFKEFLDGQRALAAKANWNTTPPILQTAFKQVHSTRPLPLSAVPPEMAAIPATQLRLRTEFRVRECGFYDSSPPEFTKNFPGLHFPRSFEREIKLKPYAIDLTPVTNAQFAQFLKASGYQPRHPQNFLKHWTNAITPPFTHLDHPVVYVDLDDARAYARWNGKHLPTEEEWQYAAQGPDSRKFPWGNEMLPDRCNQGQTGGTTSVRAFPEGRSPFGLYDLCGNVWEWTESEGSDGRTRFCILRGGCFYQAKGSQWYADGGPQPCDFAAKFLLTWSGLDRCATIGFRCVKDLNC